MARVARFLLVLLLCALLLPVVTLATACLIMNGGQYHTYELSACATCNETTFSEWCDERGGSIPLTENGTCCCGEKRAPLDLLVQPGYCASLDGFYSINETDACEIACGVDGTDDPCSNGVKDENETNIDCGGDCRPCNLRTGCDSDVDCGTGFCDENGECAQAPFQDEAPDRSLAYFFLFNGFFLILLATFWLRLVHRSHATEERAPAAEPSEEKTQSSPPTTDVRPSTTHATRHHRSRHHHSPHTPRMSMRHKRRSLFKDFDEFGGEVTPEQEAYVEREGAMLERDYVPLEHLQTIPLNQEEEKPADVAQRRLFSKLDDLFMERVKSKRRRR